MGRGREIQTDCADRAAVVVGSVVILFDPIFHGLAIAMMFGAVASTALTLLAVPLLYYEFFRNKVCPLTDEEVDVIRQEGGKNSKKA